MPIAYRQKQLLKTILKNNMADAPKNEIRLIRIAVGENTQQRR